MSEQARTVGHQAMLCAGLIFYGLGALSDKFQHAYPIVSEVMAYVGGALLFLVNKFDAVPLLRRVLPIRMYPAGGPDIPQKRTTAQMGSGEGKRP